LIAVFVRKTKLLANAGECILKRHHPAGLRVGNAARDRRV